MLPLMRDALFLPSGGLRYHLRALAYRRTLWLPFRRQVAAWLAEWQPPCDRVVLVGPSAGHTLPLTWLERFAEWVVLEPDPLARWWLARRAPGPWRFEPALDLRCEGGVAALADRYPDAALLFCNLLGQLGPPDGGTTWPSVLAQALAGRHWASWHDVLSTSRRPDCADPAARVLPGGSELPAVVGYFWSGGRLEVVDHATFALGGDVAHAYALWRLRPRRWHLIEWVTPRQRSPGSRRRCHSS